MSLLPLLGLALFDSVDQTRRQAEDVKRELTSCKSELENLDNFLKIYDQLKTSYETLQEECKELEYKNNALENENLTLLKDLNEFTVYARLNYYDGYIGNELSKRICNKYKIR